MAYDNRWTLNKNARKEQSNHPDYKGSINVDGVDYWLDGWIKDGANGKFISGSIKPKEQRVVVEDHKGNVYDPNAPTPAFGPADLDDDVPF